MRRWPRPPALHLTRGGVPAGRRSPNGCHLAELVRIELGLSAAVPARSSIRWFASRTLTGALGLDRGRSSPRRAVALATSWA